MYVRNFFLLAVCCVVQSLLGPTTILAQTTPTIQSPEYSIIAGGDVMLGRRTAKNIQVYGNGDYGFPWKYVVPTFLKADISFINLEAVASHKGAPLQKRYAFRFDPAYLQGLVFAGVDVVSQANNHALDYGYVGLCDSYNNIDALGISVVGTGCTRQQAIAPVIKTLPDGTRVAFLAMSEFYQGNTATKNRPGFAPFSVVWMTDMARSLKDNGDADIVIVSVHAGIEHSRVPGKRMEGLYRSLIDGGVDVVLGHHPHVPQPIEQYADGWIVYSLGNLIFDMHDVLPGTKQQILAKVRIRDGRVIGVRRIPIEMNQYFQPFLVADKERIESGHWEEE